MLSWIKSTKFYLFLAGAAIALIGIWGQVQKARGRKEQQERNTLEHIQREEVTRERGRQANEKINSGGDDFIPNWLRDNNRFRD